MKITQLIRSLHRDESGQDLLEYALVTAAVLAVVVTGSQSLATTITNGLATINTAIQGSIAKVP